MKRLAILMCCVLLSHSLSACGAKKDSFKEPVNFYYEQTDISYNSEHGVIAKEVREGSTFQGNVTAFMHAYLRGPKSGNLRSIIPSDVYLVSCTIDGNTANVTMSAQFSKLTGVNLTTACSAVLLTLRDYTGVEVLSIQAKDSQLEGMDSITLTLDDVILIDTTEHNEQAGE